MKIAVFGIGGVGGTAGGALAKKHADTYFYVRGENLKAIRQNGLKVQSVLLGDFVAHPKLASDTLLAPLGIAPSRGRTSGIFRKARVWQQANRHSK